MKTNLQLQTEVLAELQWEPAVTSSAIEVTATDGIITLNGSVPFYAEKLAAERATRRVQGVLAIAEELTVRHVEYHDHKDSDLAIAVANALKWHVWVPDKVHATVEKGWVTLSGEVKWAYQRNAAQDSVSFLFGVNGVSNEIVVKPGVATDAIRNAIQNALKRDAQIDADNIQVESSGGKVTLTGKIHSWNERDSAAWAAWSTPGVSEVQNDLAILS